MATFPQITSPPQASAEVIVNEALETLEHQAVYGKDHATTTGLVWGYYGGRWGGFSIADGTVSLTNTTTNYLVVAIATGVLSTSTATTNWNDGTNYARVYKITTAGGVVTGVEDHRAGPGGVHGGSGGGGGGAVTSVAGRTGAVTLTIADIDDSLDIRNLGGALANDGTTDDAAVFAAAIASGAKYISARGLNVAILTQVSLAAGVTLDITGSTITTTGSTITTFKADTIDDWALIADGATIVGAGTTTGSAKALHVVGCNRYKVRGLRAKNIKGHGFYVQPGTPSGSIRGDQGVFESCSAEACYKGWEDEPGAGAEYTIVRDFRTTGCTTWGVKTSAGNVEWNGGHDIDNVGDGFVMVGGSNHAHGIVTGRSMNHNGTYNLNASGVVNGETFVGCHFYEKLMLLDGCKGVTFISGIIDIDGAGTIEVNSGTGSGKCRMNGVYFPGDYGQVSISGTAPRTLVNKDGFGAGNPGNVEIETVDFSANYTYGIDDESANHPDSDTTARDLTIPANSSVPFPIGKVLSGTNGTTAAGVVTLKITSDTLYWSPTMATGNRTLAAGAVWAIKKVSSTKWILTGVGIT